MTRVLVQRGSGSSSTSSNRPSQNASPQNLLQSTDEERDKDVQQDPVAVDGPLQQCGSSGSNALNNDDNSVESGDVKNETGMFVEKERLSGDEFGDLEVFIKDLEGLEGDGECSITGSSQIVVGHSCPPPPPVPPPKPSGMLSGPRRTLSGNSNAVRIGSSRKGSAWPIVSARTSPSHSRPSSPKSFGEAEGYNSADEQSTCFGSSYGDVEREHSFEHEIKRVKGLEVRRMKEDGNCLFRAVADQVYGDPELYDLARQMCIDYMERERDHFSQFITEGFVSYCKRKRRDKVYGNNVEIQAFSEMYNRPIHIYSYSAEPINIFHGGYITDTPPLRLSYHQGNHYNSLVDPRRLSIGAGLGLSSLQGANINKDQVKAAIKAQQDRQIDNALLAEGRFYSDLEFTEKEIEQMVLEASRAEYFAEDKFKQQLGPSESSTSTAEPSSSGAGLCEKKSDLETGNASLFPDAARSESMQMMLSMGFSYLQVVEAYSIFGDDVDSMLCYLLDTGGGSSSPGNSRQKGKATE